MDTKPKIGMPQPPGHDRHTNPAVKYDRDKPPLALISPQFRMEIGKVLKYGEAKYGEANWLRHSGLKVTRLTSAAERHLAAWETGESLDPETGLSHLAHAASCMMMLFEYERREMMTNGGIDDRRFKENKS